MAFNTAFNAISFNGFGLRLSGDPDRYVVRWGDGARDVVSETQDSDFDSVADFADPFHTYATSGTYDVVVRPVPAADSPAVRLQAFIYSNETAAQVIRGSALQDIALTGTGADDIRLGGGDDWIDAGGGADRLAGGDGDDRLLGGAGDDLAFGDAGIDVIEGGSGNDRLLGGAGDDFLFGDRGRDNLFGGDGDDLLSGGVLGGPDRLTGGAGADTFFFVFAGTLTLIDPDRDVVSDFEQGTDLLDVSQWRSSFDLIGGNAFSGAGTPEIRQVATSGGDTIVSGDFNGDAVTDFSFRLVGLYDLTPQDFTFGA